MVRKNIAYSGLGKLTHMRSILLLLLLSIIVIIIKNKISSKTTTKAIRTIRISEELYQRIYNHSCRYYDKVMK